MKVRHFISLVDTQARMALKAQASRFYLSYFWWVIEPLLFVGTYYLVFEVLLKSGRGDFLLFLVCGKIPFLWFAKSVTAASSSIVHNRGLINQTDMPKTLYPYISIQESLYREWVVFLVMFVVVIAYGHLPGWNWLWLVPLIIVQYMLIAVCSLLGAFLVSFIGDFRMLISMGIMFLMFASGLFWDVNTLPNPMLRKMVFVYNPLAYLIDAYRQVLMYHNVYDMSHLVKLATLCGIALVFAHQLLRKTSRLIAAKVVVT